MSKKEYPNLIKNSDLTPQQRREKASKAGKASGEAKRRKKNMKEQAQILLSMGATEAGLKLLDKFGEFEDNEKTASMVLLVRQYFKAIKDGDERSARFLLEVAGEMPSQKLAEKKFNLEKSQSNKSSEAIDDWVDEVLKAEKDDE